MLPNMIVERLMARQPVGVSDRPAEARPLPEFHKYSRMSPPRRRRNFVAQNSVPTPSSLSPFASLPKSLPDTSSSLPASPSTTLPQDSSNAWRWLYCLQLKLCEHFELLLKLDTALRQRGMPISEAQVHRQLQTREWTRNMHSLWKW